MKNHMRAQWVRSRERRIALYKRSSINQKLCWGSSVLSHLHDIVGYCCNYQLCLFMSVNVCMVSVTSVLSVNIPVDQCVYTFGYSYSLFNFYFHYYYFYFHVFFYFVQKYIFKTSYCHFVCVCVCVWSPSNRIIPCGVNKMWLDLIEVIMMDNFCLCSPDQLSIFLQIHF